MSGASNPASAYGYRNGMDIESDDFHPASAYGYRNGSDIQSDNYTPASEYGYRNGMDQASDAYTPSREYGYRNGSDIQSDAFNPARPANYRNGADIASDQTRRRIDATARTAQAPLASGPPLDPTDGFRAGPTRERAAQTQQAYLKAARDVVGAYHAEMTWRDKSSGRLEAPPIAPEDVAFLAAGIVARGGRFAAEGIAKVFGEDASAVLVRKGMIGDSAILRRAMLDAGMTIPDGFVAHHLIPSSMAKGEFSELFEIAAKSGYNINAGTNGMALPRTIADALESSSPLHRGGHLGEYFESAQTELQSLRAAVKAGDLAPSALPQALYDVSLVMQAKLISREIFLTRQDPMYLLFRK